MRSLIALYPEYYRASPEFLDLQNALQPETEALWEARDSSLAQLDLNTATWGLPYWEHTLGLPVEPGKSAEDRRSRVRSKLLGAGVTTVALIKTVSESFAKGSVEVTEAAAEYKVIITFVDTIGIPPNMDDLTAALREIMPAHLTFVYVIRYNTWEIIAAHTWAELSARTWQQVKEVKFNHAAY